MKFNCDRSLLLNAVTIASRTVALKSTIPALEGILFETAGSELTLTGYNLKTGIRTKVDADILSEGSWSSMPASWGRSCGKCRRAPSASTPTRTFW